MKGEGKRREEEIGERIMGFKREESWKNLGLFEGWSHIFGCHHLKSMGSKGQIFLHWGIQ